MTVTCSKFIRTAPKQKRKTIRPGMAQLFPDSPFAQVPPGFASSTATSNLESLLNTLVLIHSTGSALPDALYVHAPYIRIGSQQVPVRWFHYGGIATH